MAIDARLKFLADWHDDIEQQMRDTTDAGAAEVSDSDAMVRRLALISLRRDREEVQKQINIHLIERGGGDPLFGFRLRQEDANREVS